MASDFLQHYFQLDDPQYLEFSAFTPDTVQGERIILEKDKQLDNAYNNIAKLQDELKFQHLNIDSENEMARNVLNEYDNNVNNILNAISRDPANVGKYQPMINKLRRDLISDSLNGRIYHMNRRFEEQKANLMEREKLTDSLTKETFDLANRAYNNKMSQEGRPDWTVQRMSLPQPDTYKLDQKEVDNTARTLGSAVFDSYSYTTPSGNIVTVRNIDRKQALKIALANSKLSDYKKYVDRWEEALQTAIRYGSTENERARARQIYDDFARKVYKFDGNGEIMLDANLNPVLQDLLITSKDKYGNDVVEINWDNDFARENIGGPVEEYEFKQMNMGNAPSLGGGGGGGRRGGGSGKEKEDELVVPKVVYKSFDRVPLYSGDDDSEIKGAIFKNENIKERIENGEEVSELEREEYDIYTSTILHGKQALKDPPDSKEMQEVAGRLNHLNLNDLIFNNDIKLLARNPDHFKYRIKEYDKGIKHWTEDDKEYISKTVFESFMQDLFTSNINSTYSNSILDNSTLNRLKESYLELPNDVKSVIFYVKDSNDIDNINSLSKADTKKLLYNNLYIKGVSDENDMQINEKYARAIVVDKKTAELVLGVKEISDDELIGLFNLFSSDKNVSDVDDVENIDFVDPIKMSRAIYDCMSDEEKEKCSPLDFHGLTAIRSLVKKNMEGKEIPFVRSDKILTEEEAYNKGAILQSKPYKDLLRLGQAKRLAQQVQVPLVVLPAGEKSRPARQRLQYMLKDFSGWQIFKNGTQTQLDNRENKEELEQLRDLFDDDSALNKDCVITVFTTTPHANKSFVKNYGVQISIGGNTYEFVSPTEPDSDHNKNMHAFLTSIKDINGYDYSKYFNNNYEEQVKRVLDEAFMTNPYSYHDAYGNETKSSFAFLGNGFTQPTSDGKERKYLAKRIFSINGNSNASHVILFDKDALQQAYNEMKSEQSTNGKPIDKKNVKNIEWLPANELNKACDKLMQNDTEGISHVKCESFVMVRRMLLGEVE